MPPRRCIRALARLSHPHVVTVHEVGESDGTIFLAMEYVRGQSFRQWLRKEPGPAAVGDRPGDGIVVDGGTLDGARVVSRGNARAGLFVSQGTAALRSSVLAGNDIGVLRRFDTRIDLNEAG